MPQQTPPQHVPPAQQVPLDVPGVKHANVPLPHGTHCPLLHTELGGQQVPLQQMLPDAQQRASPDGEMQQFVPPAQQICLPLNPQANPLHG